MGRTPLAIAMQRALLLATGAGSVTALLTLAAAGAATCIDTVTFYNNAVVLAASLGAALVSGGSVLAASGHARLGIVLVGVGALLVATAIAVAPFKGCGQFYLPT
jgi:hypothetical protein